MHNNNDEMTRIPEITTEELRTAINKLKKGKSPDSNGIRAEDIKACDEETKEMVREIFNEIIKRNEFTPEAWKKVKIKVIHRKGDVENVGNYRPICSLPALYNLFSTKLYGRFFHDSTQNKRKIRQDSEAHTRQLKALKSCGIEHDYTSLLKKIYRDQEASVLTDEESDMFETTFHAGKRKKEWEST